MLFRIASNVERLVLLKRFEDGKIGLGFAGCAERLFATVGDEVIRQTSPVGNRFVKRVLDPEKRDVGDAYQETGHA